jgi:hypothetical protein
MKTKTRKSKAAKVVRNLPVKTLNAESAKGVKGGDEKQKYFEVKLKDANISSVHLDTTSK